MTSARGWLILMQRLILRISDQSDSALVIDFLLSSILVVYPTEVESDVLSYVLLSLLNDDESNEVFESNVVSVLICTGAVLGVVVTGLFCGHYAAYLTPAMAYLASLVNLLHLSTVSSSRLA